LINKLTSIRHTQLQQQPSTKQVVPILK